MGEIQRERVELRQFEVSLEDLNRRIEHLDDIAKKWTGSSGPRADLDAQSRRIDEDRGPGSRLNTQV